MSTWWTVTKKNLIKLFSFGADILNGWIWYILLLAPILISYLYLIIVDNQPYNVFLDSNIKEISFFGFVIYANAVRRLIHIKAKVKKIMITFVMVLFFFAGAYCVAVIIAKVDQTISEKYLPFYIEWFVYYIGTFIVAISIEFRVTVHEVYGK